MYCEKHIEAYNFLIEKFGINNIPNGIYSIPTFCYGKNLFMSVTIYLNEITDIMLFLDLELNIKATIQLKNYSTLWGRIFEDNYHTGNIYMLSCENDIPQLQIKMSDKNKVGINTFFEYEKFKLKKLKNLNANQ